MAIKIELDKNGCPSMLRNDLVDLRQFGPVNTWRASRVEPDNEKQDWVVTSALTGKELGRFGTHKEAIDWEIGYYSPGGAGWKESKGG